MSLYTDQFVKEVNALRLASKGEWYTWQDVVNGKQVYLKAHNTWVQRIVVDGVTDSSPMELKPTQFKQFLIKSVT